MDVVRSLSDRIVVLHQGKLVADGKPAEVINSDIVREAYLGGAPLRSAGRRPGIMQRWRPRADRCSRAA